MQIWKTTTETHVNSLIHSQLFRMFLPSHVIAIIQTTLPQIIKITLPIFQSTTTEKPILFQDLFYSLSLAKLKSNLNSL